MVDRLCREATSSVGLLVVIPTTTGRGFAVRGLVPGFFGLLLRVIVDGLALVVGVHADKRADKNQESFESHNVVIFGEKFRNECPVLAVPLTSIAVPAATTQRAILGLLRGFRFGCFGAIFY